MRTKLALLIFIILLSFTTSGCSVNPGNKPTGFAYIMQEANELQKANKLQKANELQEAGGLQGDDITKNGFPEPDPKTNPGQAGPEKTGTVYLTFDDGPDNAVTPLVLNILETYGIKATFFVIGTSIEENPEVFRDIVRRGHSIGNHTYSHRYKEIFSDENGFMKSIRANEEVIFRISGLRPRIVRNPGGKNGNSDALERILAENGYRMVYWNVDSYDSRKPFPDGRQIAESVINQAGQKHLWPGMVILMHDSRGHAATAEALPPIIDYLIKQGFEFDVLR
ncbi:MAG: hypothetical protein CVU89_02005 [Firmicutes bacterium HGW-Firmicutes-14]|nr:MAG: hypothetical protein CVU89_02005 [Firmicutes bacterium HGW-Firmicutes-14]